MGEPTDHELILLIRQELIQIRTQLAEALTQLARGNGRFEAIALNEQEVRIAIAAMRQDFSRAMLEAGEARKVASQTRDDLDAWKTRIKTLAWLLTPMLAIVTGLALEAIRRLVFP